MTESLFPPRAAQVRGCWPHTTAPGFFGSRPASRIRYCCLRQNINNLQNAKRNALVSRKSCHEAPPWGLKRTEVYALIIPQGQAPEVQVSQGGAPSTGSREGPSRLFHLWGLWVSLGWWPHPSRLCLHLHVASPLGLRLLFCLFSGHCHWTQGHSDPGRPPLRSFPPPTCKDPVCRSGPVPSSWGSARQHASFRGHSPSHHYFFFL